MQKAIVVGLALLLAHPAVAALSDAERHRLAAFVSYVVTTAPSEGGSSDTVKVGDWCPDCTPGGKPLYPSKPGMVGDGSVFEKCGRCGGTQKVQPNDPDLGDMESFGCEICEALDTDVCDCGNCDGNCGGGCCDNCNCGTPERDELFDDLENAPKRADEGYVRKLEEQLTQALQEAETLKATCPDCPTCVEPQQEETPEETQPVEQPSCLTDLSQTQWNWQGTSNVPVSRMREHLIAEHSVTPNSVDKMSREELIALHNLLHNEEVRASAPQAKSKTKSYSSGGCPGGNCPTGPSRSSGRGLFGRWR
jgi:hypothetical protein